MSISCFTSHGGMCNNYRELMEMGIHICLVWNVALKNHVIIFYSLIIEANGLRPGVLADLEKRAIVTGEDDWGLVSWSLFDGIMVVL